MRQELEKVRTLAWENASDLLKAFVKNNDSWPFPLPLPPPSLQIHHVGISTCHSGGLCL